jgi:hypothetical protein
MSDTPVGAQAEEAENSGGGGHDGSWLGLSDDQRRYLRFGAMILTSTLVMFGLMYLHTYEFAHVRWSETRGYMALIMGAAMAAIMLGFMLGMYKNRAWNFAILGVAVVVFAGSLWLVRSQAAVDDTAYMNGMIPHHSIAILTSENAGIEDQRVRELADEIIAAQRREIAEMKWLINDIEQNGPARASEDATDRPVPDFEAAP